MERRVLAEAIQRELGDHQVRQLVFCTHDLDPEFFEQEILPVFIGNDLKHNRRTREIQLEYTIRELEIGIDVFYEGRALVAHEGTARLDWGRHRVEVPRGVFHPKVILALCEDPSDATESLLVCVASANLTRTSWWTNVECADVRRLADGERHSYFDGLNKLVDRLRGRARSQVPTPALDAIRRFLRRQQGFVQRTTGGTLRPQLLPGHDHLISELDRLFGSRLWGAHLEIITPFLDAGSEDVIGTIESFQHAFAPKSMLVSLPNRAHRTTISKEVYDEVAAMRGVEWASLPRGVTMTARGDGAVPRGVHAKVYRFWRAGADPIEVHVIGSHNLTTPAISGRHNWETSVIIESPNRAPTAYLEANPDEPTSFDCLDDDLETTDPVRIPLSIAYDWASHTAHAAWESKNVEPVALYRAGALVCRVDIPAGGPYELDATTAKALEQVLLRTCLLTVRRGDGTEGPILVEEQNHDRKPDLLDGLDLTAAEIFALWAIPDLRDRMREIAKTRAEVGKDEDDIELVSLTPDVQPSMFNRFAGVFHAFTSLRRRIDDAAAEGAVRRAGRLMYARHFDSPFNALRLVRDRSEDDLALAYVTYASARLMDRHVHKHYPEVAASFHLERQQLRQELRFEKELRIRLIETSEDTDMASFLDWFDKQFATEVTA